MSDAPQTAVPPYRRPIYEAILGRAHEPRRFLQMHLGLLSGSGLLTGLPKHPGEVVRQRGSSPKLLVLNTALMGAHLTNHGVRGIELGYWRRGSQEVDYVAARRGGLPLAFDVELGPRGTSSGFSAFERLNPGARRLVVGGRGIDLEEFLSEPSSHWLSR